MKRQLTDPPDAPGHQNMAEPSDVEASPLEAVRRQAEDNLRQSEEQFRQLAENIREVFFILTPYPVQMTYISPAYDEIWGRPRQELYDRPEAWMECIHPEDREYVGGFYAKSSQGAQTEMEYRVVRPDGSIRWINARAFPVRNAEGKFIRLVGIAEDITIRRQKEKAFNETKNGRYCSDDGLHLDAGRSLIQG